MINERVILVICDGLGLSPQTPGNAFVNAATPTIDYLLQNYPSLSLLAAGSEVGLDQGEPGNSEVGHLTIGTGQVLPQAFQIINGAIKSEAYRTNIVLIEQFQQVAKTGTTLHCIGLISKGGVHGHMDHMITLLRYANELGVGRVAVHAITDGRDGPAQTALTDIQSIETELKRFTDGRIASVSGRYWAMDRDHNWDRTDRAYWAMVGNTTLVASSAESAIQHAYARGETDENLRPTIIISADDSAISTNDGDGVLFTNYRPDRIRQLATRIIAHPKVLSVVTMTDYFFDDMPHTGRDETNVANAYPLPKPTGTLAQVLAEAHKRQLHVAETEKYAHVTYFFDGHRETKFAGEDWLMIPSPKVDSFDRQPEMSARLVSQAVLNALVSDPPDFVVVNFANADMVGHTGNYQATIKAIEYFDSELARLVHYAETNKIWLILTADHGNAEQKIDALSGAVTKEHTSNPVPCIIVHPKLRQTKATTKTQLAQLAHMGMLADIAPTILEIMGLDRPGEMVGSSLLGSN